MVLCLAFIWTYNTGIFQHQNEKPITIKKHDRRAKSLFGYRLEKLTVLLFNFINKQINTIVKLFLSST